MTDHTDQPEPTEVTGVPAVHLYPEAATRNDDLPRARTVRAEARYENADYRQAFAENYWSGGAIISGGAVAAPMYYLGSQPVAFVFSIGLMVIGFYALLKSERFVASLPRTAAFVFTPEDVDSATAHASGHHDWQALKQAGGRSRVIVLWARTGGRMVVPRRCLAQGDLTTLKDLLREAKVPIRGALEGP